MRPGLGAALGRAGSGPPPAALHMRSLPHHLPTEGPAQMPIRVAGLNQGPPALLSPQSLPPAALGAWEQLSTHLSVCRVLAVPVTPQGDPTPTSR